MVESNTFTPSFILVSCAGQTRKARVVHERHRRRHILLWTVLIAGILTCKLMPGMVVNEWWMDELMCAAYKICILNAKKGT